MSLSKEECDAALNLYVAYGNLNRDPGSTTLLKRYLAARNDLFDVVYPATLITSAQDIADLRHLLSIAVWIRTDQLGHPNSVRMVAAGSWDASAPPIKINTHGVSLRNCQGDLDHALEWWKRLTAILDKLKVVAFHSWFDNDFQPEKK